jgi:hypothetical protein
MFSQILRLMKIAAWRDVSWSLTDELQLAASPRPCGLKEYWSWVLSMRRLCSRHKYTTHLASPIVFPWQFFHRSILQDFSCSPNPGNHFTRDEKTQRNIRALWRIRSSDPAGGLTLDVGRLKSVCCQETLNTKDQTSWMYLGHRPAILRVPRLFSVPTGEFWYGVL